MINIFNDKDSVNIIEPIPVIVSGGTINEWTLGHDETIAKGKVSTIISTYIDGLEFVQNQVRTVFEEATD